ncbi:MAG: hypothetical protein K0A93_10130 [Desulfuromonadaceae bacterium]|nr:hypothetical protein [Desulfuromonadaceae bacterium]
MSTEPSPLEARVEQLELQLQQLSKQVAELEQRGATGAFTSRSQVTKPTQKEELIPNEATLLVGSSSLLQHISTICFLLVAALGLRALTDNDMLDLHIGTALGMGYAAILIVGGYLLYRKQQSMAPIFTTTGGLLMFSVLVETYTRHSAIPVELVYSMLAITGICMAVISYTTKTALPIIVGTFGMCLAAVAIDYPNPYFPYLGLVLWLSNVLGYFASRLKRCSWLRWILLFTTHFMLQIWGMKLTGLLSRGSAAEHLSPDWFIPIVALIGGTFMLISLFGIIRSGDEKISRFDFSLPAVNAGWCYVAGIYALKDPTLFGAPAAAAAIIHFALAFRLSERQRLHAPGTNTFTAGGVILAGLSLPAILGDMLLPLPVLSVLAFIVCYYSNKWSSGGMRMTAYLLQGYVSLILAVELISAESAVRSGVTLLVATLCALSALYHYRYCRENKPPEHSRAFERFDKQDKMALLPLFAGLVNGFFMIMTIVAYGLQTYYRGDFATAFTGAQSVTINLAAILLIFLAIFRHNKELRNVAILLMIIGGSKVFIIDLFQIKGTWLVAGIFAFGIAAALQSLVLARWKSSPTDHLHPTQAHVEPLDSDQQKIT